MNDEKEYLDDDGYPTKDTLNLIRDWQSTDGIGLLNFIKDIWYFRYYISNKENMCSLSTGGWSGNEDIIGAMTDNNVWWTLHWVSSKRGGHYEFEVKKYDQS